MTQPMLKSLLMLCFQVLFPEVLRLSELHEVLAACALCRQEHSDEVSLFEELGRLLADVRAYARRGRREVRGMLTQLVDTAQRVCGAISSHMQREETEVLPLLAAQLQPEQQRSMVWATLRAMPLRLLEKVMPWLVARLSESDAKGMMASMRLGAPEVDKQLVELLLRWAERGRWGTAGAALGMGVPAVSSTAHALSTVGSVAGAELWGGPSGEVGAAMDMHQEEGRGVGEVLAARAESQQLQQQQGYPVQQCGSGQISLEEEGEQGSPPSKRARKEEGLSGGPAAAVATAAGDASMQQLLFVAGGIGFTSIAVPAAAAAATACTAIAGAVLQHGLHCKTSSTGLLSASGQQCDLGTPLGSPPGSSCHHHSMLGVCQQDQQEQQQRRLVQTVNGSGVSPIDHIFQFHKALKQELKQLEADAAALEAAALSDWSPSREPQAQQEQRDEEQQQQKQGSAAQQQQGHVDEEHREQRQEEEQVPKDCLHQAADADASGFLRRCAAALQQLDGRFQFLRGIYRAHSKAEDEIVFPALEAKEALHNVSHAYTLDHEQEEQLFHDLAGVISKVKSSSSMQDVRSLSLQLRRMCAAVRASLETHVRAEEAELWPLFSEHFTMEEQQHLVGVIIGRTGAEVLQALLPWVTGSFSDEEREAMMDSLREATKNTMFDQWLDAIQTGASGLQAAAAAEGGGEGGSSSSGGGAGKAGQAGVGEGSGLQGSLAEIAEYLAGDGAMAVPAEGPPTGSELEASKSSSMQETSGTVAESASYRPGWEEIFNINQKQLEAAIRRVSNDPKLEPQRKAYLIQNIMVSRYIVAQQRRLGVGTEQQQQQQGQRGHGQAGNCLHLGHHLHVEPSAKQQDNAVMGAGEAAAGSCQHQQQQGQQLVGATAGLSGQGVVAAAHTHAGQYGCKHYKRKALLVAPCCHKPFPCR